MLTSMLTITAADLLTKHSNDRFLRAGRRRAPARVLTRAVVMMMVVVVLMLMLMMVLMWMRMRAVAVLMGARPMVVAAPIGNLQLGAPRWLYVMIMMT